jgi:DNA-3-methyladenine glycosylase II
MENHQQELLKAQRHLSRKDAILKALIRQVGPCTLQHDADGFSVLVRSIISQQISTRAALAISARLRQSLGRSGIRPAAILRTGDEVLRAAGMSANKVRCLRELAEKVQSKSLPINKFADMDDEEVIERLVELRGIGRWTAEMFLIFSLGRRDVLPHGDYGLKAGVQKQYALEGLPDKKTLTELAEPWRPFRSIGTWFIWRSFGNVPQSK